MITVAAAGGSFDPAGPVARIMEDLWWVMLWMGVAVFLIFLGLLVAAVRRRQHDPAGSGTGTAGHGRWLVLGGVVMPTIVILAVLVLTLQAMRAVPDEAAAGALRIEVVGHQWWWEVRYPDHGFVTANEIHIPAGEPVEFVLTSADVIHSFWVPRLGGKLDLMPEDVTTLVLEADEPGRYDGRCAEFCGLQHARMALIVFADPPDRFAEWVSSQQTPAAEPTSDTAQQGRQVFLSSRCVDCHTIRGTSTASEDGPDLTHLASRETIGAATWPNTHDRLLDLITRPHQVKEGIDMPPAELDDEELDALLSYLAGLR